MAAILTAESIMGDVCVMVMALSLSQKEIWYGTRGAPRASRTVGEN